MDPVVNSQVQSPLVRTLSTIETKAGSFTHNIPDNVPPVSFTKLNLSSYSAPATPFFGTHKFRIPQYGYLNQVYLHIAATITGGGTDANWRTIQEAVGCFLIDNVKLLTHNKELQTLYGNEMFARMLREHDKDTLIKLLGGETAGGSLMSIGTPVAGVYHFYVPIDLASTYEPRVNYSTRFVEDLEVHVTTKALTEVYTESATNKLTLTTVEVITGFHNFHDNVENAIRNSNYQRGVPASILQYDTKRESVSAVVTTDNESFEFKTNNLAYGVTGIIWVKGDVATNLGFGSPLAAADYCTNIKLEASGQTIWEGTLSEAQMLQARNYKLGGFGQKMLQPPVYRGADGTTKYPVVFYLNFGFQHNELINTGAIGMQTMNNMKLSFTFTASSTANKYVEIFTHHYRMVRIDSDTGVITTSLEN